MKNTFIISLGLSLLLTVGTALACSCFQKRSVKDEINATHAVFVGTVLNKELVTLPDPAVFKNIPKKDTLLFYKLYPYTTSIFKYNIAVEVVYNGRVSSKIVSIYSGMAGAACGFNFVVGDKYIIYGEETTYLKNIYLTLNFPKGRNIYWTDKCLRTMPYSKDEIVEIEKHVKKGIYMAKG